MTEKNSKAGFFAKLLDKLDKKIKDKAERSSCCCSGSCDSSAEKKKEK